MNILALSFWISAFLVFYIYAGYPLAVFILAQFMNKRVKKKDNQVPVTVVIAAFNEENSIGRTIENKLRQNYPKDLMEIIVVSDASTDGTDRIVDAFKDHRVRLMRQHQRLGKTAALNRAVAEAAGEIIIFSDANSQYDPDAIGALVACFSDPRVGYVTGKMVYLLRKGTETAEGCSAYMNYENVVRVWESRVGSVVGVDGGIDAVRKELYLPMSHDQLPDLVLPLRVIESGHRVVYEPGALLNEEALGRATDEFAMRVRVSLRAFNALWDMRHLLNIARYPLYGWQLISHKVLRYLAWVFILYCLISNLFLFFHGGLYVTLLAAQALMYLASGLFLILPIVRNVKFFSIPYYFLLINTATLVALGRFIKGQKQTTWTPRVGN